MFTLAPLKNIQNGGHEDYKFNVLQSAQLLKSFFNQKINELVEKELEDVDSAKALASNDQLFYSEEDEPIIINPNLMGLLSDSEKVKTLKDPKFIKQL